MTCVVRYRGPPLSELDLEASDLVWLWDQVPAVVLTAMTASEIVVSVGPYEQECVAQYRRHGRNAGGSASCLAGVVVGSL